MLITDPIDLLLDSNNDLVIRNGDLVFSTGMEAIAQQCRIQLQTFQGEWFLNLDIGIPYWQSILGFKPAIAIAAAKIYFTSELLSVIGVKEVTRLDVDYTGVSRTLNIKWQVNTVFGDTPADTIKLRILAGSE